MLTKEEKKNGQRAAKDWEEGMWAAGVSRAGGSRCVQSLCHLLSEGEGAEGDFFNDKDINIYIYIYDAKKRLKEPQECLSA